MEFGKRYEMIHGKRSESPVVMPGPRERDFEVITVTGRDGTRMIVLSVMSIHSV